MRALIDLKFFLADLELYRFIDDRQIELVDDFSLVWDL